MKHFLMVYRTIKISLIILIIPNVQTESSLNMRMETIRSLFLSREAFWPKYIGFKLRGQEIRKAICLSGQPIQGIRTMETGNGLSLISLYHNF